MGKIICISFVLITFCGYAQYGKDRYKVDSLQVLSPGKFIYEFNLSGPSQGLYFDDYRYMKDAPRITLRIINNTNKTVINNYRERDSHITWMRGGKRADTLKPGEYMQVWGAWDSNRPPSGFYNSPVEINYQVGDSVYRRRINIWGEIHPHNYVRPENKEVKPESKQVNGEKKDATINTKPVLPFKDTVKWPYYLYKSEKIAIIADAQGRYMYHLLLSDLEKKNPGVKTDVLKKRIQAFAQWSARPGDLFIQKEQEYLVLTIRPQNVSKVSQLLNNVDLVLMIDQTRFFDNTYRICLSPGLNWTESEVQSFFKKNGVSQVEKTMKNENGSRNIYSWFVIVKAESKDQEQSLEIMQKLMTLPEIKWVSSGINEYHDLQLD